MKKSISKKIITLVIAFVMVLGMIPMNVLVASAAGEVTAVDLTVLSDLLLSGAIYTDGEYKKTTNITVDTANCTVESIEWEDGGYSLADGIRFDGHNEYKATIVLNANVGETFDSNATVTVNGTGAHIVNRYANERLQLVWHFFPRTFGTIERIEITTPEATPGNAAISYNYAHIVAGKTQYTVKGDWYEYDEAAKEYKAMAPTDTFKTDGTYRLTLDFKTARGYSFENLEVMANNDWLSLSSWDSIEGRGELYYSYGEEISTVFINVPEPVVGQSFSNATPIKVTVPSGSKYTIEGNWRDEHGNFTGTFEKGKEYYFESKIYANAGYYFARDINVNINDSGFEWCLGSGKIAYYSYRKSLKYPINEVILNNVPKAELGKTLQVGVFPLEVPANAKYQVSACWYEEGTPISNPTIQADKRYTLEIWLYADNEYDFATPCVLKINGIDHQISGGSNSDVHTMEYSFLERIGQIEVIGVVKPLVGQTPSTDTLKSAEPEKYEIISAEWLDTADGSIAAKFENGHNYELNITVEAKQGYEFAPGAFWTLDGKKGILPSTAVSQWDIHKNYSFETVISEIRLDNIPSMKIGEPSNVTGISVPNGAKYIAHSNWRVWNNDRQEFEAFSGVFEQGKTYQLVLIAMSAVGYRFDEETTLCYIDGVLNKDVAIEPRAMFYEINFVQQGAKEIHKVELNIKKPLIGSHYSVPPILTMPQNVNYSQQQNSVPEWIVGDINHNGYFFDYFKEGGNYGANFDLVANEGYVFAEDLVVVVNGIILPVEAYSVDGAKTIRGRYFFDMVCQHIEGNAATCTKKAVCDVCGQEYGELAAHTYKNGKCTVCGAADSNYTSKTEIPKTGDYSAPWLWLALLFVSGTGIFGITLYDRKRKAANKI